MDQKLSKFLKPTIPLQYILRRMNIHIALLMMLNSSDLAQAKLTLFPCPVMSRSPFPWGVNLFSKSHADIGWEKHVGTVYDSKEAHHIPSRHWTVTAELSSKGRLHAKVRILELSDLSSLSLGYRPGNGCRERVLLNLHLGLEVARISTSGGGGAVHPGRTCLPTCFRCPRDRQSSMDVS